MAFSLSGERSHSPARPFDPASAVLRWIGNAHAARARRLALGALLELDDARLEDLGISRFDLMTARSGTGPSGLNAARSRNTRA